MSRGSRLMITLAAVSLLLATLAGAYGSHGLALGPSERAAYDTAVAYQFYHSLGLGLVGLWHERHPDSRLLKSSAGALVIGLLLFCGGIYARTLGAPRSLEAIVPLGGLAFMAAWTTLALGAWLAGREREHS
jgi:uncharacterized membrane protein YgdD (TMEM256/DUF423 family)